MFFYNHLDIIVQYTETTATAMNDDENLLTPKTYQIVGFIVTPRSYDYGVDDPKTLKCKYVLMKLDWLYIIMILISGQDVE